MSAIHFRLDMQQEDVLRLHHRDAEKLCSTLSIFSDDLAKVGIRTVDVAFILDKNHIRDRGLPANCGPFINKRGKLEVFKNGVGSYKNIPAPVLDVLLHSRMNWNFQAPLGQDEWVAFKDTCSLVRGTPGILEFLNERDITQVILSGMCEGRKVAGKFRFRGSCITETARDFVAAGYPTVIVAEGTDQFNAPLTERKKNHERFGVNVEPMTFICARPPSSAPVFKRVRFQEPQLAA